HQADSAFNIALRKIVPALDLLIERFEHAAGSFAGIARTLERHLVAARVRHHAEPTLDQREVLAVLTEQRRGAAVVVEGEQDLGRRGVVRFARSGSDSIVSWQVAQCLRLRVRRVTGRRGILPRFAARPRAPRTGYWFRRR